MNSFIESLNQWGSRFTDFGWPMFWQSSLLILVVFAVDWLSRNKIRASVRYALWLVVLLKLCLPPTLAFPTSPAWWLHKTPPPAVPKFHYTVTYDTGALPDISLNPPPAYVPPKPAITAAAWLSLASSMVSALLFAWLLARWGHITRQVHRAKDSERLTAILTKTRRLAGVKSTVPVKVTGHTMSPAVCGLFHPVILVPQSLADGFSDDQLRAVLLHELIHLRRRDVWLNCLQALVQIAYWWHPLVWLANARIRRVREEAVDDAVMLALRDEGDSYAPTLLEVAKLALNRPLAGLGLVGILESRSALRQRIERLVNFRAPRKAGLTLVSLLGIMAFTAVAVPMGEAPAPAEQLNSSETAAVAQQSLTLKVNPEVFIKNVKAQAAQSLRSPTNDYTVILLDLLRTEGVDCAPPNGIKFNTHTGEITMQNTPDNLEIFREVIEQLNRTDGPCELPLNNNPLRKRIVVIEARIYQMPSADLVGFVSGLQFYHGSSAGDDWWSASPEQFSQLVAKLEASSLQLIQRPRIQTASGITANFFIGSKTNSVEFDCKPFVTDGFVDLALRGKVVVVAPASEVFTNYFSARASAEDRGGIVMRVKSYGGNADNNLVAAIGVEIVTNTARFQQRLQAIINRRDSSGSLGRTNGQSQLRPDAGMTGSSTGFVERVRVTIGPRNSTNTEALAAPWEVNPLKAGGSDSSLENTSKVEQLFTRTFAINAHGFTELSRNMPGLDTNDITTIARSLFSKLGVDWDSPKGKTIFYTERLGWLYVRATMPDLDTIQRALPDLNLLPPQIHIKARFIELPGSAVGDVYLGSIDVNAASTPLMIREGHFIFRNSYGSFTGILAESQFQAAFHAIENSPGFEELAEPEGITTSGRKMQMRATQVITVITNFGYQEISNVSAIFPQTNAVETGPILDTVATVMADGYTIDLKTTASLTKFMGYDQATNTAVAYTPRGQKIDLPTILPRFAISEASANIRMWDGQTVVLGGGKKRFYDGGKWVSAEPEYFQKANAAKGEPHEQDKEVLVFITGTLVDAAGNRIHSDDEVPYAKTSIPPQTNP